MYHSIKTFIHINTQGLLFWMVNALVISTIKSCISDVLYLSLYKFISRNTWISIIMAFLFVMSPLYYLLLFIGHSLVMFLWMPLLLFSIERTSKQKFGLFIVTITLIMINNFYFAYYLCLIVAGYILLRIILNTLKILFRGKAYYYLLSVPF